MPLSLSYRDCRRISCCLCRPSTIRVLINRNKKSSLARRTKSQKWYLLPAVDVHCDEWVCLHAPFIQCSASLVLQLDRLDTKTKNPLHTSRFRNSYKSLACTAPIRTSLNCSDRVDGSETAFKKYLREPPSRLRVASTIIARYIQSTNHTRCIRSYDEDANTF